MLTKIIHFLILSLVILLPLVNSHFFGLFWFKELVVNIDWSFEFTKTIFFNIFSGIIILLFFIKNFNKKIIFPKIIFIPIILLFLTTIFSPFYLTSFFWEYTKWHWLLMFLNLILLFIVFINQWKDFIIKILKYLILSSIFVLIISIKEYFYPSFDYWDLSNRAIWTFWHPNYLALYILVLIPLVFQKIIKNIYLNFLIYIILILTLLITKSIFAIFLAIVYILLSHRLSGTSLKSKGRLILIIWFIWIIILSYIIYNFWLLVKLNSFFSRFYIWETSLEIIFSNIKIFLIWNWSDTLSYIFDLYKSKQLYIFENIWFTADRPHNILLNIFYSFWVFWLILFLYFIYNLIKKYLKNNLENKYIYHSIFLFLLFLMLNFSSIWIYFIITILLSYIYFSDNNKIKLYYLSPIFLISFISIFSSIIYYSEEYKKNLIQTSYIENSIYKKLKLENPEKKALHNKYNKIEACESLTKIKTSENYFFCWDLLWNQNKEISIIYYKKWLELLPNMWNKNSIFYENFIIKSIYSEYRFFHEKYSNLKEILKRVNSEKIELNK